MAEVTGRPSAQDLAAAAGVTVPDVVGEGLSVLFCGINPGLWSGAVGHHFARPGNRFWSALQLSGFVPEVLRPEEERRLLDYGLGITNLVARATATAVELSQDELRAGAEALARKVAEWDPRSVAFLGIGAYRTAFARSKAALGEQPERLGGARTFVLPNPSGVQARYQLPELAALFAALRRAVSR